MCVPRKQQPFNEGSLGTVKEPHSSVIPLSCSLNPAPNKDIHSPDSAAVVMEMTVRTELLDGSGYSRFGPWHTCPDAGVRAN